mgnify:CR=1 FL=1|tara:strand:- start:1490 stop:1888 length:399 start_codon:yes stop_codon:yes gene_type:complete
MNLEILNIASDTINNKDIENYTHLSKLKNSLCGDEIQIKLIVKNDKIIDFGYQGNSCIYCQAAVSLLSKISINNKKNEINELCDDAKSYFDDNKRIKKSEWVILKELFQKQNLSRKECILLPFKTLKRIVSN